MKENVTLKTIATKGLLARGIENIYYSISFSFKKQYYVILVVLFTVAKKISFAKNMLETQLFIQNQA